MKGGKAEIVSAGQLELQIKVTGQPLIDNTTQERERGVREHVTDRKRERCIIPRFKNSPDGFTSVSID